VREAKEVFLVVSVCFNGSQRRVTCVDKIQLSVAEENRVTDVLEYIQACYPEIPLHKNTILVTINNKLSDFDQVLKNDDHIFFIPHIGGGY